MLIGAPQSDDLGFSLNPLHYVKKAAVATGHGVVAAGHGVTHAASAVGHGAVHAAEAVGHGIKVGIIKPFEWLASKATAPIRNRVHTLRDRRAKKIAWDKRKSTTPTPSEQAEAKAWTKSHLKKQGPQGQLLQLFAGTSPMLLGNATLGDPVTLSLIAASIPVFMALMNKVLHKADASGQAPADPTKGGGAAAPVAPVAPGTVDLTPVQDAAAAAAADASGGGGAGGDAGAGGGEKRGHGGGGGAKVLGLPKKYVMIGGAVLGGVLVLSLLMPPKKG